MVEDTHRSTQWSALLQAQADLLVALVDLGQRQVAATKLARINELLSVLGQKQGLLNRLTASLRRLAALSDELTAAGGLTEAQRRAYRQQQALSRACFDTLFAMEKSCEQLLNEHRERHSQRSHQAAHYPQVANAYRDQSSADSAGERLDLSSAG